MQNLPFNLENIIFSRTVESCRVEYKSSINDKTKPFLRATLCAFANDYYNINGGWVILGIEAPNGEPILPPIGILDQEMESTQQKIRVLGKQISPNYHPHIFTAKYMEKNIIIVYAPAGEERPYQTEDPRHPGKYQYFIREGAETVSADEVIRQKLIELCAKVPFDDRINIVSEIKDIDLNLLKSFIIETQSDLSDTTDITIEILKSLRLVSPFHDGFKPRNVSLLMFNSDPSRFFKGAYFEVAQFRDVDGGDLIEENSFRGPLDRQIADVISYMNNLSTHQLKKVPGRAKVDKVVAFPYEALEEAITNAAYHRGYGNDTQPSKIYLYPDRMEIVSYPGPVAGLKLEDFKNDKPCPQVPLRNRRLGEFLKELKLAEMRSTGIPKIFKAMQNNGSPTPKFEFDVNYFRVILPAHPRYLIVHSLRESSYLWSIGEKKNAILLLENTFSKDNSCGAIAGQLIEYLYYSGQKTRADEVFKKYHSQSKKTETVQPYLRYFRCLINDKLDGPAAGVLELIPEQNHYDEPLETAIAFKRIKEYERAHIILSRIINQNEDNFDYYRNFAEVKIALANELYYSRRPDVQSVKRLRREAHDLLVTAIQLSDNQEGEAWCHYNLARTKNWLHYPASQIEQEFTIAITLLPGERTFREVYERFKGSIGKRIKRT